MLRTVDGIDHKDLLENGRCRKFAILQSHPPPKKTPTVEELIAMLYRDNKCRFEFQCVAGHQMATR